MTSERNSSARRHFRLRDAIYKPEITLRRNFFNYFPSCRVVHSTSPDVQYGCRTRGPTIIRYSRGLFIRFVPAKMLSFLENFPIRFEATFASRLIMTVHGTTRRPSKWWRCWIVFIARRHMISTLVKFAKSLNYFLLQSEAFSCRTINEIICLTVCRFL